MKVDLMLRTKKKKRKREKGNAYEKKKKLHANFFSCDKEGEKIVKNQLVRIHANFRLIHSTHYEIERNFVKVHS